MSLHNQLARFTGLIDKSTAFRGASGGAMVAAGAALNISTAAMYDAVCNQQRKMLKLKETTLTHPS